MTCLFSPRSITRHTPGLPSQEDWEENELSLREGFRLLSACVSQPPKTLPLRFSFQTVSISTRHGISLPAEQLDAIDFSALKRDGAGGVTIGERTVQRLSSVERS